MKQLLQKVIRWVGYTLAVFVIAIAIVITIARMLTPVLDQHLPDLETLASNALHAPVKIRQAHLLLRGISPGFQLDQVQVLDKTTFQPILNIAQLQLNLSLWRSLIAQRPILSQLRIAGVDLNIREKMAGEYDVAGLYGFSVKDQLTGASLQTQQILQWIFSQAKLTLNDINLHITLLNGTQQLIRISQWSLTNQDIIHSISGEVILEQEIPTDVEVNIDWQGQIDDLSHAHANMYFYLKGLSLPQWLHEQVWHDMQINHGTASAKIWLTWQSNNWQSVRSQFQLYDLALYSQKTQHTIKIPRIMGDVDFNHVNDRLLIKGKDILLDLETHYWPTLTFELLLSPSVDQSWLMKSIQISYLDLNDSVSMLSTTGLLSDETVALLMKINPMGELKKVWVDLPLDAEPGLENISASAQLNQVSFKAWNQFPAITNLSGVVSWDKDHGEAKLASKKLTLVYPRVWLQPLQFREAHAQIKLQKNAGNWNLSADELHVINADIDLRTAFTMDFTENNPLPKLDLEANFSTANVKQLQRYLPLALTDIKLKHWLQQAFLGGQIRSGKASIHGDLNHFPFVNEDGKFLISCVVKNAAFRFAPDWPVINHGEGKLVFSGSSMTADVQHGLIFDVPIYDVHAVITNIGIAQPTLLTVEGEIKSDLANGLYFIHHSPLQDTIGDQLAALNLSGPMNLKLNLSVPLANPKQTKVIGDVSLDQAILKIPEWNIIMKQINGTFQFTTDQIISKGLSGILFGKPARVMLSTQVTDAKQTYIRADLQSELETKTIENWLHISMKDKAVGAATYQLELDLPPKNSSMPTHIVLLSDLKGVKVDLPFGYEKTANEVRNLKLELFLQTNSPLKTKVYYGDQLSAALTIKRVKNVYQIISGEIMLGGGEPDWQTIPGFVITGKVDQFDWDTAKNESNSNPWWREVNVTINRLNIMGRVINAINVMVTKAKDTWLIRMDSQEIAGQINIPVKLKGTIQANLRHLYLSASELKNSVDPSDISALKIKIDELRYGDKNLGQLELETQPVKNGLNVSSLRLTSPVVNLQAAGSWNLVGRQNQTHLEGEVTTSQITKLLDQWGYDMTNLVGSDGNVEFDLNWSGVPFSPDLASLAGEVKLKLGPGRIINLGSSNDAKLGIGRMLSILNLETIPRRLSLNFSDLFENGYSFDYIKGHFHLAGGSAVTQDMHLDGPVARVEIEGRIGLVAKDYDLTMRITTYITESLPLVATIAGGPLAGIATWVVSKAVSTQVSGVGSYHYKVRGPWGNPQWESGS